MRSRISPLWVAVPVLAVAPTLLLVAPTAYWLDSAEFAGVAACMGIAHPPGHPVVSLLGKAAALIPLGDVALRVNALSTLLLGAAALALFSLIRDLGAAYTGDDVDPAVDIMAGALALLVVWSSAAVMQGVRAEVYTLHLALISGAAALLVAPRVHGFQAAAGAGLLVGLALANHHFLTFLAIPGLVLLGWKRLVPATTRVRVLAGAVAGTVAGLCAYLYLPARASALPPIQWGRPTTLAGVWKIISAQAFQKSVSLGAAEGGSFGARWGAASLRITEDLLWVGALAGLAGIAVLTRRRETRSAGLGLAVLTLGTLLAKAMLGFDPANPDDMGYLLVAVMAVAAAGIGIAVHARGALRASMKPLVAIVLVLSAGAQLVLISAGSLASFWDSRTLVGSMYDEVPAGGVLVTSTFRLVFPVEYFRVVEGWRPDVPFIQRKMFSSEHAALYAERDPRLAYLAGESERARLSTGAIDIPPEALAVAARERPLLLEFDLWIDPARLGPARAAGVLLHLGPADEPKREALLQMVRWERLYEAFGTPPSDPWTLRNMLWAHYVNATWAHRAGHRPLAIIELDFALALAPGDPELMVLEADIRRSGASGPGRSVP